MKAITFSLFFKRKTGTLLNKLQSYFNTVKRHINFKSTFTKLILSYLVLASVILSLSTVIPYLNYKNKVIGQINNVSEKLLVQSNYFADYILNWTAASGYHLYRDTDIFNLMYGRNLSYTDEVVGKRKLTQSLSIIPLAHSIYIYNGVTRKFYSTLSDPRYLRDFYDREAVEILENRSNLAGTRLIPRKINFSVDGLKGLSYKGNVLTIVVSDYPLENNLEDGALILNLDARDVQNVFKNIAPENSDIFVIDKAGTVVSHSDPEIFMNNLSGEKYIQEILSSHKNRGYLIEKINGKPTLITYVFSEKLNLAFISAIPYNDLLSDLYAISRLTLLLSIILLVIGVILSYLFSRQIYFPIRRIVANVQQYLSKQKKSNMLKTERMDELDYLSTMLDNVFNSSNSLEKLSQVDINFLRQQLLKGLLLNNPIEIKELDSKFRQLNINIRPENLMVYILRIDSYREFFTKHSKENRDLIKFAVCNIASEITSRLCSCEAVDMGEDHMAVVLNSDRENCSQKVNDLAAVIEDIQRAVHQYLDVSVTGGIGGWADTLASIPFSYESAHNFTNYRFKYGPGSILFHDKIMQDINEDYRYPEEKEKNLFNAIKLGHIHTVKTALGEMLNEIRQYSYEDMLLAITQLIINSKKLLKTLYNADSPNVNMDIGYFRKNLEKFESLEEVRLWLLDLFSNAIQQRDEKRLNRKEDLVKRVIGYIQYNYTDPSLSPELIADYVNISPNYLRSIFKEVAGGSISAFINEYRLEKARKLLETTAMSISEISDSIGFSNDTYFYTAYKKFYGITPNQHRRLTFDNIS